MTPQSRTALALKSILSARDHLERKPDKAKHRMGRKTVYQIEGVGTVEGQEALRCKLYDLGIQKSVTQLSGIMGDGGGVACIGGYTVREVGQVEANPHVEGGGK